LGGFEVSPTLMERKDRLKTETDNLTIITSRLKETFVDGVEKVDKMEDDFKGLMKQSLLISITHIDNLTSFPLLTLAKASSGNNPGEPASKVYLDVSFDNVGLEGTEKFILQSSGEILDKDSFID
jgi:hypothetical protein